VNNISRLTFLLLSVVACVLLLGCSSKASTTSPGGGEVVLSDSIIVGEIRAVRAQSTGYPWEIDILIVNSENVDDLVNPTKDKVGQVVTVKTDQDMTGFTVGQSISARIKYVGDVPKPGIVLYIYDIKSLAP
jgi:hypothetical protein